MFSTRVASTVVAVFLVIVSAVPYGKPIVCGATSHGSMAMPAQSHHGDEAPRPDADMGCRDSAGCEVATVAAAFAIELGVPVLPLHVEQEAPMPESASMLPASPRTPPPRA